MAQKIFVNLPVKDVNKSAEFFKQLGYTINPKYSDETAVSVVISEEIYAMLLIESKFSEFTPRQVADTSKTTEVITCLSAESKDEVNKLVDKAIKAGGTETRPPQDYGFMYGRSFNDLDGHIWEIVWMDESGFEHK
jgi:predicted lactoylglutathione lyase